MNDFPDSTVVMLISPSMYLLWAISSTLWRQANANKTFGSLLYSVPRSLYLWQVLTVSRPAMSAVVICTFHLKDFNARKFQEWLLEWRERGPVDFAREIWEVWEGFHSIFLLLPRFGKIFGGWDRFVLSKLF